MPRVTLPLRPDAANGADPAKSPSLASHGRRRRLSPLVADARRLARLLGVGVRSVRTWDYGGKLPRPVKLGARTVWVLSEIRAWLSAGAPDRAEWEALKKHNQR